MPNDDIELILDEENWCSFYYELAIEVSKSNETTTALEILDYLWKNFSLIGPFDRHGIQICKQPTEQMYGFYGVVELNQNKFPIVTWFIQEDQRSSWITFSFSDGHVSRFDDKEAKISQIYKYLENILHKISNKFSFRLALIGEDCSGFLTLDDIFKLNSLAGFHGFKMYIQTECALRDQITDVSKIKFI